MSIVKFSLFRSGLVAVGLAAAGAPGLAVAQTGAPPAQAGAAAPSGSKIVARVDGTPITEADLAVAADDPALSLPGVTDEQKRDLLVGYLIDLKIGAKAAETARVGEGADFARKLAYFRDKLLLGEHL
ncbi:MAG TPA: peptidylprolyl isomerase, partial [Beijerinckiaceae bacterium]|nr:peptidylprolyl isomerase [Beijerinckiaceae bacterium]